MGTEKYNFGNINLLSILYPVHHKIQEMANYLKAKFRIIFTGLGFEEVGKKRTVFTLSSKHVKESTFAKNGQDVEM